MAAGEFVVHKVIGIAKANFAVAIVVHCLFLFDDICANGHGEVVRLPSEVCCAVVIDVVVLERRGCGCTPTAQLAYRAHAHGQRQQRLLESGGGIPAHQNKW